MADIRLAWDLDERQLLEGLQRVENRLEEIEKELGKVDKSSNKAFRDGAKKTTRFESAVNRLKKPFQNITKQINSVAGLVGVAFSVGAVVAFGRAAVRAFDQQEKAVTKVRQALVSTGNASQLTLKQLTDEASRLQSETIFGDEQILEGATAQLLTFTNIAGDNFLRTQQVALDLSTVLGTDLQSSAIQLGKALNDPVANLSALSRSGIQFSDSQKEVIKELANTNRLAEAQVVILEELERQYGGQAQAALAGAGRITQFSNTVGDLYEVIGERLVAILSPVAETTQGIVESLIEFIKVETDAAEAVDNTREEFNRQIEALKLLKPESEARSRLITEINGKYREYLPNLISEKDTLEDINILQQKSNQLLLQKALFIRFEEELNAEREKTNKAINDQIDASQRLVEGQNQLLEKTVDFDEATGAPIARLQDVQFDVTGELEAGITKAGQQVEEFGEIVDSAGDRTDAVRKKYEELAEQLGFDFEQILETFTKVENQVIEIGSAGDKTAKSFEELFLSLSQFASGLDLQTIFQRDFLGQDFIKVEGELALQEFDNLVKAIEAQAESAGKTLPKAWRESIQAAREEIIKQTEKALQPQYTFEGNPLFITGEIVGTEEDLNEALKVQEEILDLIGDGFIAGTEKQKDKIQRFNFGEVIQKLFKLDDSELEFVERQAAQFFESTLQALDFGTELQIIQQDRLIEKLDERIAKQKELVDKEAKLAAEGFANNLNLEKEQLAVIEEERKKATERKLRLQREAAKRELAVQQALQVANLTSAAIEVFGSGAKFGLPGILFAASAVATLFSLVAQAKAQAAQFATPDELRGGGLFDGPNLLSHEQQRKRGRYHRIEGSNLAIERGEWIIGTKHSKEHSDFLADLNSGKYTGIDLAANLEFARSLSRRSRAIRSGSDGQMVRDIMRRASGYDELKSEMRGIRSAVEAVQSEIKRKPTVIPSGRNQIIIEDGLHQSSRIVEIK